MREWGKVRTRIYYDNKTDLLYIRLDEQKQEVMNKKVAEDIVLDIGGEDRIVDGTAKTRFSVNLFSDSYL